MIWSYVAGATMSAAVIIVASFVALGLMVVLHEFGHVMAFKLVGLKVERVQFGDGKRCHIFWPRWLSFPIVFYSVVILSGSVQYNLAQYMDLSRRSKIFCAAAGRMTEVMFVAAAGLLHQIATGKWWIDVPDIWGWCQHPAALARGQAVVGLIDLVLVLAFVMTAMVLVYPSGDYKEIYQLLRYGSDR